MDEFESELNIIHTILKNDETYTKLELNNNHYSHWIKHKKMYMMTYKKTTHCNILMSFLVYALCENPHINEIWITVSLDGTINLIEKIITSRHWKSIFVSGHSLSIIRILSLKNNNSLTKLKLSSILNISDSIDNFMKHSHLLEYFEFNLIHADTIDSQKCIAESIKKSNIKTLVINVDICNSHEFIKDIIQGKIRNIHLNFINEQNLYPFNLTNNHNILNFTVNKICPDHTQEIINKNKCYMFTILLCMNKKIIPRCVFKNLILKHLFMI